MSTVESSAKAAPVPLGYNGLIDPTADRKTGFRWVILALVFFGTTINYLDRLVMGLLATDLQHQYSISNVQYGYIQSAFALSYAYGQLVSGGLLDKFGIRLGYGVALTAWSLASIFHAVARGPWGFGIMRAFLGVAESPAFPAATKTLAEWFPKRERALAFGFVNAGTNMGAILAPLVVPWLASNWGWQSAFIATGAIGFIWLLFWIPLYRKPHEHPRVSAAELAHINSDPPETTSPMRWQIPQGLLSGSGRIARDVYWEITLGVVLFSIPVMALLLPMRLYGGAVGTVALVIFNVFAVMAMWVLAAAHVKRWHDLGRSGWLAVVTMAPLVAALAWYGLTGRPDSWLRLLPMLPALATAIFLGTLQVQRRSANRFGTPSDYTSLISHPQAWAFAIGKFLTDSMWWFYMTWLPKFLYDRHDLNLLQIGLPLIVIYLMADVGSISGGWLSSAMIKRGYTINRARKTALLICALGVLPIMFAQYVSGMWTAVLILGLATASHQGFSSNLYTLVSDMFPRRAVGSVAGLGGTCGYLGASAFQILVGYVVVSAVVPATPATAGDTTAAATAGAAVVAPSYLIPFICASLAYLVAVLVIHLLAPRLEPAIVDEAPREGFEPLPPSQPRA